MFPTQFVDAIANRLEALIPDHTVQTEPLTPLSIDKSIAVFPVAWTPVMDSALIGQVEPPISQYQIRIQNLTVSGDIELAYEQFTTDQRKIRAILYRDATLRLSLGNMSEGYLGYTERFKKMNVIRQATLPARRQIGMYFLCETDVQIDTESTD